MSWFLKKTQDDLATRLVGMYSKEYGGGSHTQFKCPVMDKWVTLEDVLSK